ncbi:hypothetical protein NSPZN2_11385 [Nitrospira defluvii]|uniref:Uncharacterized protein n=1 Tax=Nitrospira defluvii TaxID=330214 RepID=A0ABM8QTI4_9BACT|nr:hypothetical protein NSPZN2_11385 [Nitrospira defluvii]
MLTQADRLTQGVEEDLAIRAIAKVQANFRADVARELVVQVGRETFEDFHTIPLTVTLVRGGLASAWICAYAVCHGGASS